MKTIFRSVVVGFLGLSIIVFGFYFTGLKKADSAKDTIDLHIRVEVSTDNGQTWKNTAGTDYSGGQTVSICQGESFQIRTRIWNTGNQEAYQVTGLSSSSDSSYITNASTNSNDEDGDGVIFNRLSFKNNGSIYVASVAPNGSYDDSYQGSIVTIHPPDECSVAETEVYLTANIQGYASNSGGQQQGQPPLIGRLGINSAKASGIGNMSRVKIIPCGCQTGKSQEASVNSGNTAILPQTGADFN